MHQTDISLKNLTPNKQVLWHNSLLHVAIHIIITSSILHTSFMLSACTQNLCKKTGDKSTKNKLIKTLHVSQLELYSM